MCIFYFTPEEGRAVPTFHNTVRNSNQHTVMYNWTKPSVLRLSSLILQMLSWSVQHETDLFTEYKPEFHLKKLFFFNISGFHTFAIFTF